MTNPILIVDDEPKNLAALEQILGCDYDLIFARNGDEAIAAAHKHAPSLILLDIKMPGKDGYEVCRELKADKRTEAIPVIFVTGLAEVDDEAAGFAVGAVDYIIKPVSPAIVSARVHTHLSLVHASTLEQSYLDAIYMLGEAGHHHDTDTGVHIWRMAAYAGALAAVVGWSATRCKQIALAALMHDTGKIGIPDGILKKPGKLDADEWLIMQQHARMGHRILARSNAPVFQMAAEIALRHHEKWDGSGYPDGLAGDAIPESARIVALADVFDALTTKRPYKAPWPLDQVMATVRKGSGSHFEPRLVDAFVSILPHILDIKATWDAQDDTAEPSDRRKANE
ncbi:response regulator [Massilia psychrophila]|jgi:putative two-component system response regulator|uniref:Two-component system response regulator n=1 Tax=Massilia psychrophila TaxID=1603353 RepID=A0A2G8SVZ3_9BURK|nr:HD domain-containing phosphohydrolase [Massilia psychrophila]PIL37863.1 two-component system response regulator [Massilia psychrophila]GGE92346.1 two-component system response regulator [Massilia psychrophila]